MVVCLLGTDKLDMAWRKDIAAGTLVEWTVVVKMVWGSALETAKEGVLLMMMRGLQTVGEGTMGGGCGDGEGVLGGRMLCR